MPGGPPPITGCGGIPGVDAPSTVPHWRQNFIPGGFSARHVGHTAGIPPAIGGVGPMPGGGAS